MPPSRLNQKRMYLQQQSQGMGLQTYFNQMQIAEGSYPPVGPAMDPTAPPGPPQAPAMPAGGQQPQQQGSAQAAATFGHALSLSPLLEPGEGVVYDPYMSHHHYTQHLPPGAHLHPQLHHQLPQDASSCGLGFSFPPGCEQPVLGPPPEALPPDQYELSMNPPLLLHPALGEAEARAAPGVLGVAAQSDSLGMNELPASLLDSEMMETVDSQQGFVLVN